MERRIHRRWSLVFVATVICQPTWAQETFTKEEWTTMINDMADCSGVYRAFSEIFTFAGQPASAKSLSEQANGAIVASQWLMKLEEASAGQDKKRPVNAKLYTESRAETSKTKILSLFEMRSEKPAFEALDKCVALSELQSELVQQVRDQLYGR